MKKMNHHLNYRKQEIMILQMNLMNHYTILKLLVAITGISCEELLKSSGIFNDVERLLKTKSSENNMIPCQICSTKTISYNHTKKIKLFFLCTLFIYFLVSVRNDLFVNSTTRFWHVFTSFM